MKRQVNLKNNFLTNNYFSRKGQALVELATFGTILLFCLSMLINYGIQANYQQEMEMKAFRKAMHQSYNNDSKGPNAGAEINLIEDKRGISTDNAYGLSDYYPFSAGARVTWNNNLMDEYVDNYNNPRNGERGTADYRPKASYNINGQEIMSGPEGNTTAEFGTRLCSGSVTVRVPRREGKNGRYWEDITIDCATQTKVFEEETPDGTFKVGYIRNVEMGLEKQSIGSADVDGDRKQELVVGVGGEVHGPIVYFVFLDFQRGRIDTTVDKDMDYNGDLKQYVKEGRQGLLPDYLKESNKQGSLGRRETTAGILTTATASSTETITRRIKLNNRMVMPIASPISYEKNSTWSTSK